MVVKDERGIPISCTVDLAEGGSVNKSVITNHQVYRIESTGLPSRIKGTLNECAMFRSLNNFYVAICGYRSVLRLL